MAKGLAQLEAQIAKMQEQAEALRRKEAEGVMERIREAIRTYGFKPRDLFGKGAAPKPRNGKANGTAASTTKVNPLVGFKRPVRYRDANGNEWTGMGLTPVWLREHIEQGASKEDFLLPEFRKEQPASAPAKKTKARKKAG
jgi:DNA-binding protein H-NS